MNRRRQSASMSGRMLLGFFGRDVMVEEAIIGHQMVFTLDGDKGIMVRVNGRLMDLSSSQTGPAHGAVEWVKDKGDLLTPGWIYTGSYIVGETPRVIITKVEDAKGRVLDHEPKFVEADRLGAECAPLLHTGVIESLEQLQGFFNYPSTVEGTVWDVVITPLPGGEQDLQTMMLAELQAGPDGDSRPLGVD